MRLPIRRTDDADVIRARLRQLLAERAPSGGWVPEEADAASSAPAPDWPGDDAVTAPLDRRRADGDDGADPGGLPESFGRHRAPGPESRWNPGRLGARSVWLAGLLAALLLAGWTWTERPRVEAVDERMPASHSGPVPEVPAGPPVGEVAETSPTVVVSVVGQVASPGLVTLPSGSRVADAVAAAGGLLPAADPASVNLAAVVSDGEQLVVGLPGGPVTGGSAPGSAPGPAAGGRVDLNRAGVTELDGLPGIGPVLAQRIVDHRVRQGPFRSVEELDDVPGIGPSIAAALTELVTV